MTRAATHKLADLEAIITENARLLGEEPSIGVHCLRDGRVRIYDLAIGWRRRPFREYSSIGAALGAAEIAKVRTTRVAELIAGGESVATAVRRVFS